MIARWMIAGFVLWLALTLAFRFISQDIFHAGPDGVPWLFMTAPLVMFGVTYALLTLLKVDHMDRAEAASIFALPGLVVGIYEINSFTAVFPNLDPALSPQFAALMFACYASVIVAGIVSSRLKSI